MPLAKLIDLSSNSADIHGYNSTMLDLINLQVVFLSNSPEPSYYCGSTTPLVVTQMVI